MGVDSYRPKNEQPYSETREHKWLSPTSSGCLKRPSQRSNEMVHKWLSKGDRHD